MIHPVDLRQAQLSTYEHLTSLALIRAGIADEVGVADLDHGFALHTAKLLLAAHDLGRIIVAPPDAPEAAAS